MAIDDYRTRLNPDLVPHELRDGYDIRLPVVVAFEGLGWCFYTIIGFRHAKPAEYFLDHPDAGDSQLVEGIRKPEGTVADVWVVRPTFRAKCIALQWEIGDPIPELPPLPLKLAADTDPDPDPGQSER